MLLTRVLGSDVTHKPTFALQAMSSLLTPTLANSGNYSKRSSLLTRGTSHVTGEWSVKTGCHKPLANVDRGLDLGTPGGSEWPFHNIKPSAGKSS